MRVDIDERAMERSKIEVPPNFCVKKKISMDSLLSSLDFGKPHFLVDEVHRLMREEVGSPCESWE
jgi:hypothetical protein